MSTVSLPADWTSQRLDELEENHTIVLGRGSVLSKLDIEKTPGEYPIYSSSVHKNGYFGSYGKYMFDQELISWSVDGGGNFFYRPRHKFSITNVSGFLKVLNDRKLNCKFLAYQLMMLHGDYSFDYQNKAHPSVIRKLYTVLIPPIEKQEKIVSMLVEVDNAIDVSSSIIARTRDLKIALMQQIFSSSENQFPIVPLSSVAKVQTGIAKNSRLSGDDVIELPYLRVANVQDGHLDLNEVKEIKVRALDAERFSLKNGDVLLTEGGDHDKLGRGFVWEGQIDPCLHQNHVFAVRTHETLMPKYLSYLTQSSYGKKYFLAVAIRTTNLASINSTKLKAFPVPLAPLDEQEKVVAVLTELDRKIELNNDIRLKQEELKRGLMKDLLTGKVDV